MYRVVTIASALLMKWDSILEKALGIKPNDLERNQTFLDKMSANGLHLDSGAKWIGLGKQQKGFPSKSGKNKGKR